MTARTVVIGTAGHIDHGKTTLLRALTGMDADRLPEERRRGMTIDVGYAHLDLEDGTSIDFVDVPGHDKLVGNMLVGAGEIDAAMVVVAADDGPRAQTMEHLELLDALGIRHGIAVITKIDAVDAERVEVVRTALLELLDRTTLAGSPILASSGVTGLGIDAVRAALVNLRDRAMPHPPAGHGVRLPIDRVFSVKGRGTVVTGTLTGSEIKPGADLVVEPGGVRVRVREVQVHGRSVDRAMGGRTALLLAGVGASDLRRGQVVGGGRPSSRILVAVRPAVDLATGAMSPPPEDGARLQLHIGTDRVGALVVRSPRESVARTDGLVVAILRLEQPVATRVQDRFALRDPGSGRASGGVVLWTDPPRGVSRRRATPERLSALVDAVLEPSGTYAASWLELAGLELGPAILFADDVREALEGSALTAVRRHHESDPSSVGPMRAAVAAEVARTARRLVTVSRESADVAAATVLADLAAAGRLAKDGDRLRDPARASGPSPEMRAAMDRLEAALASPTPPALADAARTAGCSTDGIRALEAEGRIVRLDDDLAWAASTYRELARTAVTMAARGPLTPAAYRDATGSSRKYVMAILEDLDRRELLRRTDAGHVLGRRSLAKARPAAAVETP